MTGNCAAGEQLAKAAAALIGTRFRLHGRDAANGLDCVGLVYASLQAIGRNAASPEGYGLRNSNNCRWIKFAEMSGLYPASHPVRAGDIAMVQPGPAQHHLMIFENPNSAIHAHAGLRRVVRQPMPFPLDPLAHWRVL